jgi:hypothetical protein
LSFFLHSRAGAALQEVVPVNGEAFRGGLVSVDTDGRVLFRVGDKKDGAGETRSLPLKELVRWGHPAAPRAQTIVVLADGGRIITSADWAGGAAVRLVGDDVVLLSDIWDEVPMRRALVRGVVFAQQSRGDVREKLVETVFNEPSPHPSLRGRGNDVVWLTNRDRLTGTIVELERGALSVETLGGVVKIPLSRVEAIAFASGERPRTSEPSPGKLAIGLRDGSLVYAKTIRADDAGGKIELENGVNLSGASAADVLAIQSLDGLIVYLSDIEGADYRSVPYLTMTWPYTRDRNVMSGPIEVRGKRYWKGIGMHSAGRLTYRFDGGYKRFDAAVAIDDAAKGRGSVTFGVYVLRDGNWGEAFKSPIVRGGAEPQAVSVDLRGARGLTLTVDFADRGDELDHAVWLDARLVR